jgi:nitrile hydratase accessory protein
MRDAFSAAEAGIPASERDADGPVFREPWEAQVFALAIALHERGLYAWSEWTAALAAEIAAASATTPEPEDSHYRHWLAALERLSVEKGVAAREGLAERKAAWDRAARATPHGRPIALDNDPDRAIRGRRGAPTPQ